MTFFDDLRVYKDYGPIGFFSDLESLARVEAIENDRLAKYWAKRDANLPKAQRLYKRLQVVREFDLWKATAHIEPDFFGSNKIRFNYVKSLYEKKARIEWTLKALYNYWAYDEIIAGFNPRRGFKYSTHRRVYLHNLAQHKENMRQKKWDAKRARVRAQRRAKKNGSGEIVLDRPRRKDNGVALLCEMQFNADPKVFSRG